MSDTTTNNKARVLVAEDNPALALVVRFHLENAGFRVTVARNGEETWSLLQQQDFDAVVTDQQMPGLSGSEVCARMRREERLAGIPVVMLTAKGLEMELDRMRKELGVWQVLPKPFSVRQLVEIVESCTAPSGAK
jgi:two-component system alkaline phosphatase synthesis response regulator PhoP